MADVILGISIGTRTMGMAMIKDDLLCEWRIKSLQGAWSNRKLKLTLKYIERYIYNHEVACIALKAPHHSRSSKGLRQISSGIQTIADKHGLSIACYSIEELKLFCNTGSSTNKITLRNYVVEQYPHLAYEFNRELIIKNPYYDKVFAAIVAAKMYSATKRNAKSPHLEKRKSKK
jgi:hypothetical protein